MSVQPRILSTEFLDKDRAFFNTLFDERFDKKMADAKAEKSTSLCVLVTKGTLD